MPYGGTAGCPQALRSDQCPTESEGDPLPVNHINAKDCAFAFVCKSPYHNAHAHNKAAHRTHLCTTLFFPQRGASTLSQILAGHATITCFWLTDACRALDGERKVTLAGICWTGVSLSTSKLQRFMGTYHPQIPTNCRLVSFLNVKLRHLTESAGCQTTARRKNTVVFSRYLT